MKKASSWGIVLAVLVSMVLVVAFSDRSEAANSNISPNLKKWMDPLPIPPIATPGADALYPGADYYEITMTQHAHQFHSQLLPATVRTYGENGQAGVYLGPTIVATTGKPVVIKYINLLPTNSFPLQASIDPTILGGDLPTGRAVPHLHGGPTAAEYDGTPDQWWTADGITGMDYVTDTFTYTNEQPASLLWYHDHAMGITRHNPYLGLAAGYLLLDSIDDGATINGQKVPVAGGPYHLPIIIQDKAFNANGTLFYPTVGLNAVHPIWVPEFFADVPVINGKAYPFLNAEPRRYRLRLLNGSQARFYNLKFVTAVGNLPFYVIGSEGGLLPAPVLKTSLLIAPGERFDAIVDFTGLAAGTIITLKNDAKAPYPAGQGGACTQLLQIRVNLPLTSIDDTVPPASLVLPANPPLTPTPGVPPRDVVMQENMDPVTMTPIEVLLNGRHFTDPVADFVKAGTTEVWQFINLTGDAHPMHTHLVQFQTLNRQAINLAGYTTAWNNYLAGLGAKPNLNNFLVGLPIAPAPEETGLKDTVKSYPGQVTRIVATFNLPSTSALDPVTGSYGKWVYHCHILEHEENDMMQPFEVIP
jgi:spore coat protein A